VFTPIAKDDDAEINKVFKLLGKRKDLADAKKDLPIFKYEKDSVTKYVLPLVGKGLWGDIWGYVSLQQVEGNVVITGIVMDHAGETPGLGAEIATTKVQEKFSGKKLYNEKNEIVVKMLKGGKENKEYLEGHSVDAITGGTKTCDGVNAMLETSIGKYSSFLLASQSVEPAKQPEEGRKECDAQCNECNKNCNEACDKNCEECENRKECCKNCNKACDKNCKECENRKECCTENCEKTCENHCDSCCKVKGNVELTK
jgi:Na+-transporting NADH:ubiquinone oxidoreductase subunit C